ncbi:MFS general substrate transporter [Setomelanomma holmii]|uniref:MFS general substrate transporter n=1 Tax=Setomelanomma holmii TaxID=210430 RepID=A0A9P4GZR3_9PLEO|nr:MFS general substrate transporter [Setomelanomma holmii]
MGSDIEAAPRGRISIDANSPKAPTKVGREELAGIVPPHESYEGHHRFDPHASWTIEEEGRILDRGNLSNALADNLLKDLNLTSDDYNNGTTIQLLCFLTAEFPVQFLTKRYGFKYILPTMMLAWGTASWGQAWMHDRTSFYLGRAAIGLCEGGFIPGVILFATYFYKSKELSIRLAAFWSTFNVACVISALLAAGILEIRGIGGKPGCGWYTKREEVIMVLTALKEPATFKDSREAWSDSSMWDLYFIGLIAYIPASPVQGYLTLTLKRLDSTTFNSNMLTVPSAVLQIITMLALAYFSDYFNERTFRCIFSEFWIMPLIIALLTLPDGGREWGRFSLITLVSGYLYFHPLVSSWISENTFDVKKRAITAASYNVIAQIGSLISSQIYRKYDGPYYKQGNSVLVAICALSLVTFLVQRQVLMTSEEEALYQADVISREEEGNKRLDFRFAL